MKTSLSNNLHDAITVLWPLVRQHWSANYPMRDHASKTWLEDTRQYRSTDLEWWLSGIVLGLMFWIVVYGWAGWL